MLVKKVLTLLLGLSTIDLVFSCLNGNVQTIDAATIHNILDLHNTYRQSVANGSVAGQPAAVSMPNMTWDTTLAKGAADTAATCVYRISTGPNGNYATIGQNGQLIQIRSFKNLPFDWTSVITSWFMEHETYTFGTFVTGSSTKHYTQLVWADSVLVGCSAVRYENNMGTNYLYYCNYYPPGNVLNQTPYVPKN